MEKNQNVFSRDDSNSSQALAVSRRNLYG